MTASRSLKQRITRAFVLLAVTLAGFFSIVSFVAVEVIETQTIDARLQEMSGKLIAHHVGNEKFDLPSDLSFYADGNMPKELQNAPDGIHEFLMDGHEMQALVRIQDGKRFAVVQDMDEFEQTELVVFSALGAGFIASLLLGSMLGITTARHIILPVSELANAVSRNASATELPSLESDDEIGVLARAFAKRTDDLQQYLTRERLFTGDVSHELRTPLTIILGAAEVMTTQLTDRPAQRAAAERVRRVAAETAERVSALLLLSRSPELLDAPIIVLNAVIQSEFERCQPLLFGKPIQCNLALRENIRVKVRPELAGIVIGNLLRNACMHTDAGTVTVTLEAGRLLLDDSGSGLPPHVQSRLFERFVRSGSPEAPDGIGLGLSIVKRVVDHIGWTVRYEPSPHGGSRFELHFPPGEIS